VSDFLLIPFSSFVDFNASDAVSLAVCTRADGSVDTLSLT